MSVGDLLEQSAETSVRNEPVQARSALRLSSLLDAAAHVVDEQGYDRLTTAMVADRAGASIGTVYRYFPDRIAVLEGLGARSVRRLITEVESQLSDSADVAESVDILLAAYVDMYRTEPGFRVLRYSDSADGRPGDHPTSSALVRSLADLAARRGHDLAAADRMFRLEAIVTQCTSLIHRAFAADRRGDERFITEAAAVAAESMSALKGTPSA